MVKSPWLALATIVVMSACSASSEHRSDEYPSPTHVLASRSEPRTAADLIGAMHARYDGSWYRTLFFKQRVLRTRPDGTRPPEEVWWEWAEIPGRLRIDLGAENSGNGVIYRADSLYVFRDGALVRAEAERNALLILGFDVYGQPPARTLAVLAEEGFDLSRMHETTWQGRPAYVVGAEAGDERTKQFWVDQERLVFVRLLEPLPQDSTRIMDIRFDAYEPLDGGWIAPLVVFLIDGREVMREEYFDMVADPTLPPGVFDPAGWGPVGE